jgi:hypothetical protein
MYFNYGSNNPQIILPWFNGKFTQKRLNNREGSASSYVTREVPHICYVP